MAAWHGNTYLHLLLFLYGEWKSYSSRGKCFIGAYLATVSTLIIPSFCPQGRKKDWEPIKEFGGKN
jgi:hypothetical protein